tara:strand:- start:414 stop:695 length:282 start_codon:yes stop_codon:yes gene_type:complete
MVAVGKLVKSSKEKLGTIVKVTRYELPHSEWTKVVHADEIHAAIRPGFVVSVRWQEDMAKQTTHVFYDGIEDSVMDMSSERDFSDLSLMEKES